MLVTKVTKIGFSQIYISYINLHVNKCVLGSNSQIFIVIEFRINQTKLQICSQYLNSNIKIGLQVFSVDRLLLILSSYCQIMGIITVQIKKKSLFSSSFFVTEFNYFVKYCYFNFKIILKMSIVQIYYMETGQLARQTD